MTGVEVGSALLAFRARNARSFRGECQLSLVATAMSEPGVVRKVGTARGNPVRVLPVVGVFGANASGKSSLLRIMADMRGLVVSSFRAGNPAGGLEREPFRVAPPEEPTTFEVELVVGGVPFLYGFSVDDERVVEEWCFHSPKGVRKRLFERHGDDVDLGSDQLRAGRAVQGVLRPNSLFLSASGATRHPLLLPLFDWFRRNLVLAEAQSRQARQALTYELLADPATRDALLNLVRAADLGITSVRRDKVPEEVQERARRAVAALAGDIPVEDVPDAVLPDLLTVSHDLGGETVEFDMAEESLGTQVWLGLVGPVIQALRQGSVLLADELDASLHPGLAQMLVELFTDTRTNPRRAQLVCNAHGVTLLGDSDNHPLGRDQIWFTDKHPDGSTTLRPLADYSPRKNEALGRRYSAGMYGAQPSLAMGDFIDALTPVVSPPHAAD